MGAILEVENLSVDYITERGHIRAVDNVSFVIEEGKSLGLAGESGCGKSTIAYSLMRLHRPPALISNGKIKMDGKDILSFSESIGFSIFQSILMSGSFHKMLPSDSLLYTLVHL